MDFSKELEPILAYEEDALSFFKKKTYDSAYEKYKKISDDFMKKLDNINDRAADAAAQGFIDEFVKDLAQYKGFYILKKSEALRKHNMYMVSYILPYLLEYNENSKNFAQKLTDKWPENFKNCNIQAATFQEVKAGFVTRLFGTIISN